MDPPHAVSRCPVCEQGLCGVRLCAGSHFRPQESPEHALVICDECEAIWLGPDVAGRPLYSDPEHARCPICDSSIWSGSSRWADAAEIKKLGWWNRIDRDLDRERAGDS